MRRPGAPFLAASALAILSAPQMARYLPPGSRVQKATTVASGNRRLALVFYCRPAGQGTYWDGFSVLRPKRGGYQIAASRGAVAAYCGVSAGSGFRTLGTSRRFIVAILPGTTNCFALLGIFRLRGDQPRAVSAPFTPFHTCRARISSLGLPGPLKLLIRTSPRVVAPPTILYWNGRGYSNGDAVPALNRALGKEYAERTAGPRTPEAVAYFSQLAAWSYQRGRDPAAAEAALRGALVRLRRRRGLTRYIPAESDAAFQAEVAGAERTIRAALAKVHKPESKNLPGGWRITPEGRSPARAPRQTNNGDALRRSA